MINYEILKALHILGVVFWIGGVLFVTFILLPAIRRIDGTVNQYEFFEKIERKFAWQARFTTLLTGVSGFYLVDILNVWSRFYYLKYWWMHAMVIVWCIFSLMLFILEPLFLHEKFKKWSKVYPVKTMKLVQNLHYLLAAISIVTIIGAMIGSH